MLQQLIAIEYNTDSIGSTFERIANIDPTTFGRDTTLTDLQVDARELEYAVTQSLRRYEGDLVAKLAEKAVNRLQMPGRWRQMGPAELICEVMTDLAIRKGSLSEIGRHNRARQIAGKIEHKGKVEFAILLLPFRTASPLKNHGTLPDIGEFFTPSSLHAFSRACREAQGKMAEQIAELHGRVGDLACECAALAGAGKGDDLSRFFAQAIQACETITSTPKANAVARKRLRQMESTRCEVWVRDADTFQRLLIELAFSSMPLDAWLRFKDAPCIPVRVLACQDAGRYPCFASVSPIQISEYRAVLLDAIRAMGFEEEIFSLIDYSEIKAEAERTSGRSGSNQFFHERSTAFLNEINELLPSLWTKKSRSSIQNELLRIDPDGVLAPLFEPILFSLEHKEISDFAQSLGIDFDQLYVEIMQSIYHPNADDRLEVLRRTLIANSLRGAALYCAAYEANTGSKNPAGFDDVATMFPDALRMSIHQKDDAVGHFSVHVSPTANRTPWHGSAYFMPTRRPNFLQISIELAGIVETLGARRIIATGPALGIFSRHVNSGQAVAHIASVLDIETPQELLDLLINNDLTVNG